MCSFYVQFILVLAEIVSAISLFRTSKRDRLRTGIPDF
jgi:hypothetical protein